MNGNNKAEETLLGPYRVLDLSGGGCLLCGKLFGDLGADVIVVESPGGSPSRNVGPFFGDEPDKEKSLFWYSYSNNKRGVTINLDMAEGRELFVKLAGASDFIIESFAVGYLEKLGISYSDLSRVNPRLIWVSITPYGRKGPKSWYKGCDLTSIAASGYMWVCGEADRAPVWISYPQASLNAALDAFAGAMFANWHRARSGDGQQVDVSIQECSMRLMQNINPLWELEGIVYKRSGNAYPTSSGVRRRLHWKCRDGYVCTFFGGGSGEMLLRQDRETVKWMNEKGMAPEWLQKFDWVNDYSADVVGQETVDRVEGVIGKFFSTMTMEEIFSEALKRKLPLAPVYSAKDICEEQQLQARGFWQKVEHEELGRTLNYVGCPVKMNPAEGRVWRRAPKVGEHNNEVYHELLGISKEKLVLLKQQNVI
jgi:benzylsuccinate CoA-transferase BbsE subunit